MTTGEAAKTWMKGQGNFGLLNNKLAIFTLLFLVIYPILTTRWIYKNKEHLADPLSNIKCGNLYQDIKIKHLNNWDLAYYPLFLARRTIFVAIPTILYFCTSFQIQTLMVLNSLYIMFYAGQLPHWEKKRGKLECFNEFMIIVMSYHMICFSEFNLEVDSRFVMGYSFIAFVLLIILVNLIYMIHDSVLKYRRRKSYKQKMALVKIKLQLAEKLKDKMKKKKSDTKLKNLKSLKGGDMDNIEGLPAAEDEWDTRVKVVDEKRYNKIVKSDKSSKKVVISELSSTLKELDGETKKTRKSNSSKSIKRASKKSTKINVKELETIFEEEDPDVMNDLALNYNPVKAKNANGKQEAVNIQEYVNSVSSCEEDEDKKDALDIEQFIADCSDDDVELDKILDGASPYSRSSQGGTTHFTANSSKRLNM